MAASSVARVFEHQALVYRRTLRGSLFSSFLNPVLYLAAMGVGLGMFVDRGAAAGAAGNPALGGVSYLQYLAPGLLAATVMQSAALESTHPIMGGLVYHRIYFAMIATPISARDIALGTLAWITARLTMIALIFAAVVLAFGAAPSAGLLVATIPVAVLTGMAFAAPIVAFAATQRNGEAFPAVFRFITTPLFLLSGTFFPIDGLPAPVQAAAWLSPLWHGIALARSIAFGTAGSNPGLALAHLAVLLLFAGGGTWLAVRNLQRRLVK
jgi:lipooligosaccharide transport system permease protein